MQKQSEACSAASLLLAFSTLGFGLLFLNGIYNCERAKRKPKLT